MKILLVATVQSHIAQFHKGAIGVFKEHGYTVHVAARNNLAEKNGLQINYVDEIFDIPFERSPFSKKNIHAYKELKKIIDREQYDVIQCNTPVGGIVARLAARKMRQKDGIVVYTAHGFHFYKNAPIKNWILYYPIEKVMSLFTDKLIAINQEDYEFAKKHFSCEVLHTHGVGVQTKKYDTVSKEELAFYQENYECNNKFVILCTGELNKNKNQAVVIRAMVEVLKKVPNAKLLLAGNGPEEENLRNLIKELNLEECVILLGYRTDLQVFVHMCDMVVSASKREGLPVNIIEAMYCKKPVVASENRGHNELVKDKESGFLISEMNADNLAEKIIQLALSEKQRLEFGEAGYAVAQCYTDIAVNKELINIYNLQ